MAQSLRDLLRAGIDAGAFVAVPGAPFVVETRRRRPQPGRGRRSRTGSMVKEAARRVRQLDDATQAQ
jgi:hypothetical protein